MSLEHPQKNSPEESTGSNREMRSMEAWADENFPRGGRPFDSDRHETTTEWNAKNQKRIKSEQINKTNPVPVAESEDEWVKLNVPKGGRVFDSDRHEPLSEFFAENERRIKRENDSNANPVTLETPIKSTSVANDNPRPNKFDKAA